MSNKTTIELTETEIKALKSTLHFYTLEAESNIDFKDAAKEYSLPVQNILSKLTLSQKEIKSQSFDLVEEPFLSVLVKTSVEAFNSFHEHDDQQSIKLSAHLLGQTKDIPAVTAAIGIIHSLILTSPGGQLIHKVSNFDSLPNIQHKELFHHILCKHTTGIKTSEVVFNIAYEMFEIHKDRIIKDLK